MIQLNNISFGYKKNKPIFKDLNMELSSGFIYGLLGKNGAGKSTLLKQISGLSFPNEGECIVMGYKASERNPAMLEDIYVVPEEFQLPPVSISTYSKLNGVFYSRFDFGQLKGYLAEFELPEEAKLSTLSYGQKKKFLIAFGLATNARILILDEPTNGLDIPSKSQFRKTIASSLDEDKLIIISTHQVRDLENLIDNIVVLEKGNIIFNRNISEISEKLSFEYNIKEYSTNEVIYSEEFPGRKAGIVRNISGHDSRVDLELLFNGIVSNPGSINTHFTN